MEPTLSLRYSPDENGLNGGTGVPPDLANFKTIGPADLYFSPAQSAPVISSAQKFVIPVPKFKDGGEALIYPTDASSPGYKAENAGKPVTDWQGKPIGDSGILFFNAKDKAIQAAPGDGNAVIIINQVTEEQAARLLEKIGNFVGNPNNLALVELRAILEWATAELNLVDMYNSDRKFIAAKMTPALPEGLPTLDDGTPIQAYGLMKRDDRDICRAVNVPGKVAFAGPAATPQLFEDGAVLLMQADKIRGIQPEVFEETYRHSNGEKISSASSELPNQLAGST